mgnify:CR=1 FL=1|tara:strand:- start:2723 stop:3241 length:519 start_codon:yes stop_codon:yes gene_type:complete
MILGLDISTSRIGISILNKEEELLFCDAIKLNNKTSLSSRCIELEEYIKKINYNYEHVFIEEPFMMFAGGKTTANTMAKLQRFNGMCSYMIRKAFDIEPVLIPANKARKLAGITVKRGTCTKTRVIQYIQAKYSKFTVYYTRHGNPKPGTDDKADSVVVALAGMRLLATDSK